MRVLPRSIALAASAFLLVGTSERAAAQSTSWLPDEAFFTPPAASLREPQFALRTLWSPVFRERADPSERDPFDFAGEEGLDRELQGEAALGGAFKLWKPAEWENGGIILGIQAGVFGRFRLEVSSSDLVSSDWLVALPVEIGWGLWSARVRLTHWSAHLGDEMIEKGGAQRIDFTSESLDALVAYRIGSVRLYGGGGLVTRSSLENEAQLGVDFSDDALLRFGADAAWFPWADGKLGLDGGVDWQSADRTEWETQVTAVLGLVARNGDRSMHIRSVFHDGPSPMGQFFLTDDQYWGVELILRIGPE